MTSRAKPRLAPRLTGIALAVGILAAGGAAKRWRLKQTAHGTQLQPVAAAPVIPRPLETAARVLASRSKAAAPKRAGLGFQLVESSRQAGLLNEHRKPTPPGFDNIKPWLGAVGAQVSVVDFNNDGLMDVFLSNSNPGARHKLFRNNGDGTFTDVAEPAGLAANPGGNSGGAYFFDFDNDGNKDVLMLSYFCTKLFRNNGDGTFTDVTEASGIRHCGNSVAANVIDYDNDGRLDIVIGDYYKPAALWNPSLTRFMPNSAVGADNGGPISVYHNEGGLKFKEVPGALGIKSRGWTLAIGAYDLRGTGRPDLWFATDFGFDQVYLNEGGGRFVDVSTAVEQRHGTNGMSAEAADLDDDGHPSVFVTNTYEPAYKLGENMLWRWESGETFRNVAPERGVSRCGWAWGAKFVDLDNDGRLDLVVTNGFISANPKKTYWFLASTIGAAAKQVVEDARNWPAMGDASLSGYQKKCVFLNRGKRFEDVTDASGMGEDRLDGRGVAVIDERNDGALSLVVANEGQPAHFYRNVRANRNHWIGLKLTGTRSNRDAVGAEVSALLADRTLHRQLQPANGFMSQSDPRIHFGLGPRPKLRKIVIRWPSGKVQELADLALDRYHDVVEKP